jgi:hypothetical protein
MTLKPSTPFVAFSRAEGLIVAGLAIIAAVGVLVGEDKGWIAGIFAGALAATIRISWPLRKEPWFWATIVVFAGLNAFAVVNLDWSFTHAWSGHAISGLMVIDIGVMISIIYGLYRLIYGAPTEVIAEAHDEPRYGERDINL